jgi:hypothetical protein
MENLESLYAINEIIENIFRILVVHTAMSARIHTHGY